MGELILVVGPPCGGKSTYVEQNTQPGDLVIDYDRLAQALGSPGPSRAPRAPLALRAPGP